MKKKIFFVRHGETFVNEEGIVHDFHNIAPLSRSGIDHINRLGEKLTREKVDLIYHSPSVRTTQSARLLANILRVNDLVADYRLEERNWGDWGGKRWVEISEKLDAMNLEERYYFLPPNGESWAKFEIRLKEFWLELESKSQKRLVVVTHMGVIRALMPILLSQPREKSLSLTFENASLTQLNFDGTNYKLIKYNDISHL